MIIERITTACKGVFKISYLTIPYCKDSTFLSSGKINRYLWMEHDSSRSINDPFLQPRINQFSCQAQLLGISGKLSLV